MDKQGYLLMVEDEPKVQANNKKMLERRGYRTKQAYTLSEAKAIIADEPPRVIVLDIQLPDGNGLGFLHELRQTSNVPVLMLTAMGTREDILRGLEAGGDDYLSKPYDISIFLKRVEALLRRADLIPDELKIGALSISPVATKAYVNGEDMCLTSKEASLLMLFAQRPDKVLSAEYLYKEAWGQDLADDDNALKTVISRLRKKLAGSGYTIAAERYEGYIFERE